ncbi:MAG TPA: hypothetical protein VK558_07605 [Patescibacteria group bacterium]|nr:hypothetical protein [Patescibacteria group bacterium]
MTQNPISIPTSGPLPGLTLVQDINNALASLSSQFSGPAAPTAASLGLASMAGITWYDTGTNTVWTRNQADNAWMPKFYVNETTVSCWPPDFDGWIVTDQHSYASATSTTVPGNQTTRYAVGRRLRAVGATTGTIYGKVTSASYSAATLLTTLILLWDSGALANETLTVFTGPGMSGKTLDISAVSGLAASAGSVRQTVQAGPVDANGFPAFGGTTGSTTVTATGTLTATAAGGFGASGPIDRIGQITNPSWTGLSTNGTMGLYLDVAANGTCTTASAPSVQVVAPGGTPATTSGQLTFLFNSMIGYLGTGSAAPQAYRVAVGEVTVAGGVVTAITWYALNGKYTSPLGAVPPTSTRTAFNANLGTPPQYQVVAAYAVFAVAWNGFPIGMQVPLLCAWNSGSYVISGPAGMAESRNVSVILQSQGGALVPIAETGPTSVGAISPGSSTAQVLLIANRGF